MQRNFETSFVTQCAPVLAGLKVANLFRWVEADASAMHAMVERWAAELKPKGVTVSIIKECPVTHAYLVYVYRAKSLEESLQQPDVQQYLLREGYPQGGLQECLDHLSRCLCCEAEFPHEIGVFLGIRWKMSLALWQTRAKIIRSAVTGNAMATPLQHKRRLNASANALKFISVVSRAVHRSPGSQ